MDYVLQPAMGAYRQAFLDALSGEEDLAFLVGDAHFEPTVLTGVTSPLVKRTGSNVYLLGRRVGWQRGVIVPGMRAHNLMMEMNPRNANVWLLLILRRLAGRRTTLWGHAWPRSGPGTSRGGARRLLRRLASASLVYTNAEAEQLMSREGKLVYVAPNSLYKRADLGAGPADGSRVGFLWIGRLVAAKNPLLALEAFAMLPDAATEQTLTFVGDGPLRRACEEMARDLGVGHRTRFLGSVHDPVLLRGLFQAAVASIATEYVGLNATQSLGFGCPVVWPRNALHAPEVTLLNESNSFAYSSGSAQELMEALQAATQVALDREAIAAAIAGEYSSEMMAKGFLSCLRG